MGILHWCCALHHLPCHSHHHLSWGRVSPIWILCIAASTLERAFVFIYFCVWDICIYENMHGVELLCIYDTILQISSHKINAVLIPLTNQSSCTPCRNLRKNVSAKLLINLCLALLGLYVTYVISTLSTGVPVLCGLISALMHYFFLAVFFWMAAEAIHLHRKLVTVYKPDIKSYIAITMAICWGRLYMDT